MARKFRNSGGRGALGAAAVCAGVFVVHAAPAITSIAPVRRRLLPRLHGLGRPDHVALTFDDGPDAESTPAFLEALDGLGWRATFFMLGTMVRRYPGLAAEVAAAGHELAVHGDEHLSELWRAPWSVRADLARARDTVGEVSGAEPVWFRPPYGVLCSGGVAASRALSLRPVLWSAWGRDWRAAATPRSVAADVEADLVPGATVLLHDSDCTSAPGSWRSALGALPLLAEQFAARGYRTGTLAEHGLTER
ncbi:MAG TPA: polysaccharide deacetylase family protein [Acidimicrobiales bacterium]|nr:polysaccharide deacetylase family protein [Acidimicrobiales bacterium]